MEQAEPERHQPRPVRGNPGFAPLCAHDLDRDEDDAERD